MSTFLTRRYLPEDLERSIPINISTSESPFVDQNGYSNGNYMTLQTAVTNYNNQMIPSGTTTVEGRTFQNYSRLNVVGTPGSQWVIETNRVSMDPYTYALNKIDNSNSTYSSFVGGTVQTRGTNHTMRGTNSDGAALLRAQRDYVYGRATTSGGEAPSILGGGHPSNYIADFYQNDRWSYLGGGTGGSTSYANYWEAPKSYVNSGSLSVGISSINIPSSLSTRLTNSPYTSWQDLTYKSIYW